MLTCVCQPVDVARSFGRSASLLEMAPKPRALIAPPPRALKSPRKVITREPTKKLTPPTSSILTINDVVDKKSSKENLFVKLPDGVQLTLLELREMACRQQQQIESQHQLLAAKEQRLRYLKEQEANHQLIAAENERLRRLRDRVEAQELKLRKLRALRGQVDQNKQNNGSLTNDLDSIRALFNEKEKELSMAVAKVDELTRQLEEIRRGIPTRDQAPSAAALELDKLRRELMYRNKLNEQQKVRLCQQREALTARQEEMTSIDKRISELQDRLHRKRVLNQQLANQISAASHKASQMHQPLRCSVAPHNGLMKQPPRSNIVAVEPFKHVPNTGKSDLYQKPDIIAINKIPNGNGRDYPTIIHPMDENYTTTNKKQHINNNHINNNNNNGKQLEQQSKQIGGVGVGGNEFVSEFGPSKSDPKYQTLPYNTKFTINLVPTNGKHANNNNNNSNSNNNNIKNEQHVEPVPPPPPPVWNDNSESVNNSLKSMTVHSTPLSVINKILATPLNQQDPTTQIIARTTAAAIITPTHRTVTSSSTSRGQPVGGPNTTVITTTTATTTTTSNSQQQQQKPLNSVASTTNNNSNKLLSNIYQTSSTKILPVQPQILQSSPQLVLSPPQSASTPIGTPETDTSKTKPALPPKPAIKTPPRQTQPGSDSENSTTGSNEHAQSMSVPQSDVLPIIKARPLTIRKQLGGEQPRLRASVAPKLNGYHISLNRRIEMPPAFLFPEMNSPPVDLIGNNNNELPVSEKLSEDSSSIETSSTSEEACKEERVTNLVTDSDNVDSVIMRTKKGNLKQSGKVNLSRRVSFDPLALLLDASLEGELELVKKTATQVPNPSAANDEGITALHNAICAGHLEIVKFLVEFGCDVNAQDSDGWTPLHCAASCNNVAMVRFLVEHGACIFATTLSDHETAAEKCEEDEEGFDGCSEYLYSVQEKLGILSGGAVYAVFDYTAQQADELSFTAGDQLTVLRKGDENEREWWWARLNDNEGYIPRNLLGLYPRVTIKME